MDEITVVKDPLEKPDQDKRRWTQEHEPMPWAQAAIAALTDDLRDH
jgi:hypothetical protein